MQIHAESLPPITNRLKRAHGQLAGIIRMLDEGQDCEAIVTQLAAVSKAVDRAGFGLIALGMQQCMLEDGADPGIAKLEKLFMSLA